MENEYSINREASLTAALIQCAKVARSWHGKVAFDIYYQHAPEMKMVRDEVPYDQFIAAAGE